tara:strand:+ start:480 stop:848 length:369 start_codon:yes stop_codon:yes gene_type:complete
MSRKKENIKPCVVKKSQQWEAIMAAVEELEETGSALGSTLAEWAESARINGCDTFKSVGRCGVAEYYDFSDVEGYCSETIDDMCKDCLALETFDLAIPADRLQEVTQEEAEAAQLAIIKQCL